MFGKRKTDVLVVGAGPVGLFTALELEDRGVRVEIVDEEWRTAGHSYALAVHPRSLELLEHMGLTADLIRGGYRVDRVALYDGAERRAEMRYAELAGEYPFLVVLPQSALETLLEKRLEERSLKVKWNHRASRLQPADGHVVATVDRLAKVSSGYAWAKTEWEIARTLAVRAAFVVGADGHRSRVRQAMHARYEPLAEPWHFAVFEFQTDQDLDHEVRVVLDDRTTNVVWPLPNGRCRWSFQLEEEEVPADTRQKNRLRVHVGEQAYPFLTEGQLETFLRTRAPWFEGRIGEIDWSIAVRFERRLADPFGRGRFWLAGDAGHLTGPVGGQSMNVGLREGLDLARRLVKILREGAREDLLEDYSRDRRREWRGLLGLEGGLKPGPDAAPWVQEQCARILPCIPASGEDLIHLAGQIGLLAG